MCDSIILKELGGDVLQEIALLEHQLKTKDIPQEKQFEILDEISRLEEKLRTTEHITDDITRRGRIRGKLKRRIWIRDNDVVVIAPWDFKETERGDIVWRFTLPQVDWLKDNDHIPKDF